MCIVFDEREIIVKGKVKWVRKVWCRRWRIVKGWAEVSSGGTAGTALPIYRGNCPSASWTALFVAGTTWLGPRPTSKSSLTFYSMCICYPGMRTLVVNTAKRCTKYLRIFRMKFSVMLLLCVLFFFFFKSLNLSKLFKSKEIFDLCSKNSLNNGSDSWAIENYS